MPIRVGAVSGSIFMRANYHAPPGPRTRVTLDRALTDRALGFDLLAPDPAPAKPTVREPNDARRP